MNFSSRDKLKNWGDGDNREQAGVWIKNRERTNTQAETIDG